MRIFIDFPRNYITYEKFFFNVKSCIDSFGVTPTEFLYLQNPRLKLLIEEFVKVHYPNVKITEEPIHWEDFTVENCVERVTSTGMRFNHNAYRDSILRIADQIDNVIILRVDKEFVRTDDDIISLALKGKPMEVRVIFSEQLKKKAQKKPKKRNFANQYVPKYY